MTARIDLPPELLDTDHEAVVVREGRRSGLVVAVAIHRTVDGRSLGGCRMKPYASAEDAVRDVERLASAMTHKAAAAGLHMGGGKGVIALPRDGAVDAERRRAALQDFADLVESLGGRYVTAQDVGTTVDDIAFMSTITRFVAGRPTETGGAGDPSPHTAHGVEVAIRASVAERLGRGLDGAHVVVIGLGHVGGALAERLAGAGARLTVTDVDPARCELAERLGAEWVQPAGALSVAADVLAPCALGGILTAESVAALEVPVIAGAANNQLAQDAVAAKLATRGILWAPDFIANAGGVIAVTDEYLSGGTTHPDRVERAIDGIAATLAEVYRRAAAADGNTLTAALQLADERSAAH